MKSLVNVISSLALLAATPTIAQHQQYAMPPQEIRTEVSEINSFVLLKDNEWDDEALQSALEKNGEGELPISMNDLEIEFTRELAPEIYPNPSGGLFKVRIPAGLEVQSIEIYDFMGKLIYREHGNVLFGAIEREMDMVKEKAGTYIILFRTANRTFTEKIVITK